MCCFMVVSILGGSKGGYYGIPGTCYGITAVMVFQVAARGGWYTIPDGCCIHPSNYDSITMIA